MDFKLHSSKSPDLKRAKEEFVSGGIDAPQGHGGSWAGLDPAAKATKTLTVRLNEYQHRRLTEAAKRDRRSIAQFILKSVEAPIDEALA
jgi:predicted HicB family RNase H-like nuclease